MSEPKALTLQASRAQDGRANITALFDKRVLVANVIDLHSEDDRNCFARAVNMEAPAFKIPDILQELLRFDPQNLPTIPDANAPWPTPMSIDVPALPAFPVHALPEPLQAWVSSTAEACQVPLDLPALLSLAVCGGATARRIEIQAGPGWLEPTNLFVACLLEPGNRKSAVFNAAMRPLRDLERDLIEHAAPEHARNASQRRIKESRLKMAEKKATDINNREAMLEAETLASELHDDPIPVLPKLQIDDATPEAVELHLAAQGGRMICAGSEGGIFDVMAGRYASGASNLDCFLKGHAGDDLRVDRISRGSIVVERPSLTLIYTMQPEVIRAMAGNPSFRGKGLLARFLWSVPRSTLGNRRISPQQVPSHVAVEYDLLVRRLAGVASLRDQPERLTLSDNGSSRFFAWQEEVERMLGDSGRLHDIQDWGGKLCGLTARLAAILHLAQSNVPEPWNTAISDSTIASAIEISRWAILHAEAVIGLFTGGGSSVLDDAIFVAKLIRRKEKTQFTRRDIHSQARNRFDGETDKLDDVLQLLVERGWIRPIVATERPAVAGRKPSPSYEVNPAIHRERSNEAIRAASVISSPIARVAEMV